MQHPERADGHDVGDRRLREQERHLAEEVALAEVGPIVAVDADRDLAVEDDVEPGPGEALAQDALAGRERLLGQRVRHLVELRPAKVAEERQPGERIDQLVLIHADLLVVVLLPERADAMHELAQQVQRDGRLLFEEPDEVPRGERETGHLSTATTLAMRGI